MVYLLSNPLLGVGILISLFMSDWWTGLFAILGAFSAAVISLLLNLDKDLIQKGLLGYNSTLLACFFTLSHHYVEGDHSWNIR